MSTNAQTRSQETPNPQQLLDEIESSGHISKIQDSVAKHLDNPQDHDYYPAPTPTNLTTVEFTDPIVFTVQLEDAWTQVQFLSIPTLRELMNDLQADFDAADLSQLRLHYANHTESQWFVIATDIKLRKVLDQLNHNTLKWESACARVCGTASKIANFGRKIRAADWQSTQ